MKTCKDCNLTYSENFDGAPWGNRDVCANCARLRANRAGCHHGLEECNCAADPVNETKLTEEIITWLHENLAVLVDVEEVDTDGGYFTNDKRYLTVSLTLRGEVIASDRATIDLNI